MRSVSRGRLTAFADLSSHAMSLMRTLCPRGLLSPLLRQSTCSASCRNSIRPCGGTIKATRSCFFGHAKKAPTTPADTFTSTAMTEATMYRSAIRPLSLCRRACRALRALPASHFQRPRPKTQPFPRHLSRARHQRGHCSTPKTSNSSSLCRRIAQRSWEGSRRSSTAL